MRPSECRPEPRPPETPLGLLLALDAPLAVARRDHLVVEVDAHCGRAVAEGKQAHSPDHGCGTASVIAGGLINRSAMFADCPRLSGNGPFVGLDAGLHAVADVI